MSRIESLDGLRGIAALTVLAHHALLVVPALADPYYTDQPARTGTFEWWLSHTPLHALWEGKAGVYVFFVLSGLVLTLPAVNGRGYQWRSYYPSRLIRLYLPVWGAVALALLTFALVPRTSTPDSLWLDERPRNVTIPAMIRDVTLVAGNGGLASPLWSLTWEILFSIALPVAILLAVKLYRLHVPLAIAGVVASTAGGMMKETALIYPPMFILGVILALRHREISSLASRLSPAGWWIVLVAAVLATSSRWLLMAFGAPVVVLDATVGLMLVAAVVFVIMALEWRSASRVLSTRPLRLAGRLSFSLYLVHEPIIVAAGFAFPGKPAIALMVVIAATAIVTPLFYYLVERPSHKLARRISKEIDRRSLQTQPATHTA